MAWQDIATAPKDGTPILFVAEGKVYAGCYSKDFAPFPWVFVDDWRLDGGPDPLLGSALARTQGILVSL